MKEARSNPASRLVRIPARAWMLCKSLQRPRETMGGVISKALVTLERRRKPRKARKDQS